MKCMTLSETISSLTKREHKSRKKGYMGDATEYAARRHMLILLAKGKQKKKPTEYQLKVGKYMKQGKSLHEAHRLAKGE